jgi:hypothetical protein
MIADTIATPIDRTLAGAVLFASMIPSPMRSPIGRALLLLVLAFAPRLAIAEGTATLASISGDVRVRAPQSKDYVRADKGASLTDGTRVKTEQGASATIQYPDGTSAEVKAQSEVIIRIAQPGARPNGVVLFLGRVWAKVAKSSGGANSFEVQSANAVAGVRGTEFETGVALDGSARVVVQKGEVNVVSDEDRSVPVRGGQEVETEQTKLGNPLTRKGDPDWDGWFTKCAKRMEQQGLEVAQSLDGRLNKRKEKVQRLIAEQKALRQKIEKLEAEKKRGADVDLELEKALEELGRVTARLQDMKSRLEGAFGLFEKWGAVAAKGDLPNSKQIGAMSQSMAKIAADFADMIEEGTDQSQEGMEETMDDLRKGKTGKPKKGSAADELFR